MEPLTILLVEDNPGDVHLTLEAFRGASFESTVDVVGDGEGAVAYMLERADDPSELPDLVLLDLNLPRMTGQEVLARLRADARTRDCTVVILTSSDRESDVLESYRLQANCVVTKPNTATDFMDLVRSVQRYFGRVLAGC